MLVRLVENRLLSVPRLPFLLARLNFLDVLLVQRDRIGNAVNPNTDQPVFADASHDGGEFDGVTGLYLHQKYMARGGAGAR